MVIVLRGSACAPLPCGKPLIRPIRKRIAHLLRKGEGFLSGSVFFNAKGDPSTISLREIAYGTAQDDSGRKRLYSSVSAPHWGPVAGRQPFCRFATFPLEMGITLIRHAAFVV